MSECELACPPSGHVTMLVNNLHYFCWPSQSVDVFFLFEYFIKLMDFFVVFSRIFDSSYVLGCGRDFKLAD